MQRLTILCVGKLQETWWRRACEEYEKRLSAYCRLDILEVPDERAPERVSEAERLQIMRTEGERILAKTDERASLWALDMRGERLSSEGFAEAIEKQALYGDSRIQFVIGGSYGLDSGVLTRANRKLSFSDMTFPHQLMRVILLEQIYRAYRITRGEPYHK